MNQLATVGTADLAIPSWAAPAWTGNRAKGCTVQMHLPEHIYHDARHLISKGGLVVAADSLQKFRHHLTAPAVEPTWQMIEGTALHAMVLEPDLFTSRYIELPDFGAMQSSTNRAKKAEWIKENAAGQGLIPLSKESMNRVMEQAQALRSDRLVRTLLRDAITEVSVAWTHKPTGLRMKLRADIVNQGMGFACDLKRAREASPDGFARAVHNMRYDVQDVLYTMGLQQAGFDIRSFAFLACEPVPPYAVGMYRLKASTRMAVEQGLIEPTLARIAEAFESGYFPGYTPDGVVDIDIPSYGLHELERLANEADDEAARGAHYRSV